MSRIASRRKHGVKDLMSVAALYRSRFQDVSKRREALVGHREQLP